MTLDELRSLRADGVPHAVVDVRSPREADTGHLEGASVVPLGSLEFRIEGLVPDRSLPVVLYDDDDGRAGVAADVLHRAGYTRVSDLEGGLDGWRRAGGAVVSGRNVPSKWFGEHLLDEDPELLISPESLAEELTGSAPPTLLDVRTPAEHHRECLPGSRSAPGFDVVAAARAASDAGRPIVVHCTGRTRSIVAARTLRLLGLGDVRALENGTMGWHLAGQPLEHAADRPAALAGGLAETATVARALATAEGAEPISPATAAELAHRRPIDALHLFDVRRDPTQPPGGIPGARAVTGGQLVQTLDEHVAVTGAGVVLVSEDPVGAWMTAYWLRRLRIDPVRVVEGGSTAWRDAGLPWDDVVDAPPPIGLAAAERQVVTVTAADLRPLLAQPDLQVVSVDASPTYRDGHLPGARWASRAWLPLRAPTWWPDPERALLLTCTDGQRSTLDAATLGRLGYRDVRVLAGGVAAWRAAGGEVARGGDDLPAEPDDVLTHPIEVGEDAMRAYLDWEVRLTHG